MHANFIEGRAAGGSLQGGARFRGHGVPALMTGPVLTFHIPALEGQTDVQTSYVTCYWSDGSHNTYLLPNNSVVPNGILLANGDVNPPNKALSSVYVFGTKIGGPEAREYTGARRERGCDGQLHRTGEDIRLHGTQSGRVPSSTRTAVPPSRTAPIVPPDISASR